MVSGIQRRVPNGGERARWVACAMPEWPGGSTCLFETFAAGVHVIGSLSCLKYLEVIFDGNNDKLTLVPLLMPTLCKGALCSFSVTLQTD